MSAPAGAAPPLPAGPPMIPIPPNIAEIAAPNLFGIMIAWALYGILVVQVYIFHLVFDDRKGIQALVYGVFFLDTFQTILTGCDAYYWFASGFGNMLHIGNPYISPFDVPLLGSLIEFIVQMFFCYRIYTLGKSFILPAIIAAIAMLGLAGGIGSGILGHIDGFAGAHLPTNKKVFIIYLVGGAVADLAIAAAMTTLLLKSKGQITSTNKLLYRLVRLTMETNILTASLEVIVVVLYFALPETPAFLSITYFFGKLYSNALLVTLNNRFLISQERTGFSTYSSNNTRIGSNSREGQVIKMERITQTQTNSHSDAFTRSKYDA